MCRDLLVRKPGRKAPPWAALSRQRHAAIFQDTLIALILLLVGFLLIFMLIMYMAEKSDRAAGEAICRSSVASRTQASIGLPGTGGDLKLAPLLCRTFDIELPEKKEGARGQPGKEDVEREMAELVRRCWWQFGNGLVENVFNERFGSGPTNDCHVCYMFTIKPTGDLKEGDAITATEFTTFMNDKKIQEFRYSENDQSFSRTDSGFSYLYYVQKKDGKGLVAIAPGLEFRTTRHPAGGGSYAIAFVSPKWWTASPFKGTDLARLMLKDPSTTNYILVSELDKIKDYCEIHDED